MKQLIVSFCMAFTVIYCQSIRAQETSPELIYSDNQNQNTGGLKGTITNGETGEALAFAMVKIIQSGNPITGCYSDEYGMFQIMNLAPGLYDLEVQYIGFSKLRMENIVIKAGKVVQLDGTMLVAEIQEIELKPIIYLYPEHDTTIAVQLNYYGRLTHTYPKSDGNWTVKAETNGTLTDETGRKYYGLFWEGVPNNPIQPTCGNVVERDSLVPFLEAALDQLGLNFKEANEFIVFWLPILEQNPYNLIYFANEDYTRHAQLNIEPEPETLIRVMMGYVPLHTPVDIIPQILPERPERKGFTVVEWGGTKCTIPKS